MEMEGRPMAKNVFVSLTFVVWSLGFTGVAEGQAESRNKIVYPQAVVGQLGNETFEIDLRLGNRNPEREWQGRIRLHRQEDLQGMSNVRFRDGVDNETIAPTGEHFVTIPLLSGLFFEV